MGITEKGIADPLPQSTLDAQFYDIGAAEPYLVAGEAIKQRRQLVSAIREKEVDTDYATAYQYIMEEVAYTWFNRLIAVRFMEVNDYLPSHLRVLSSESGKVEPDLVTTPFDAELPFTAEEEAQIIQWKQDNKLDELFRFLFIKQCNALNEILPGLFEKTTDYTEVLLNLSVVDQEGVVYKLTHDIPEKDFNIEQGGQVEIIGWLYPSVDQTVYNISNVPTENINVVDSCLLILHDWSNAINLADKEINTKKFRFRNTILTSRIFCSIIEILLAGGVFSGRAKRVS